MLQTSNESIEMTVKDLHFSALGTFKSQELL